MPVAKKTPKKARDTLAGVGPGIPPSPQAPPANTPYGVPGYYGAGGYGLYGYGNYPGSGGYGNYGQSGNSQGSLTTLVANFLTVFRRKWPIVFLGGILGLMAAGYYLVKTPPTYQASALIEVSLRRPRILAQQGAVIDDTPFFQADHVYKSRIYQFNGSLMRDLALEIFKKRHPEDTRPDAELKWLLSRVQFHYLEETRIIKIVFMSPSAELAAEGANIYAEAADLLTSRENKAESDKAVVWLEQQADVQRQSLGDAKQKLVAFRAENQMDAMEGQKADIEESIESLSSHKVALEGEILLLANVNSFFREFLKNPDAFGNLPESVPGRQSIQDMVNKWRDAVAQRDTLLTRYTQKHPEIVNRNLEIEALREMVVKEISRVHVGIENSLQLKRDQLKSLQERIGQQTAQMSELGVTLVQRKSDLSALELEREALEVAYMGILKRIEEARLSADENTATVKTVELARQPGAPVSPRRTQSIVVGLVFGLLAGFGLGYVSNILDDRIESIGDIETGLELRVLGLVPKRPNSERADLALLSLKDRFGTIPETFASIRTVLDTGKYRDISHSILVASSVPEEGKTICASNLAITFAKSGKKTLLVDFDMRRPRLARIYSDVVEKSGRVLAEHSLLHALAERATEFDALPFEGPCENLEIVTSKPSQKYNPADVLGGQTVRDFIKWAHAHYDRVVIDSPPLGLISDSGVLGGLVGCVVLVCRPEKSRKKLTRYVVKQFRDHGANIVGVIVNGIPVHRNKQFTGSGYRAYADYQKYHPVSDDPEATKG